MADPRSNLFSIKQCPPQFASKSQAANASRTAERKEFFGALGKIGDLEVLNSVGAGKIGEGLRTLASVSNTIRTGCGSLPTSIGSSLDAGASWVLDNVGIARTTVDALSTFNPGIANQGLGQAKAIYERVKQGEFKTSDIPSVLQDLQNLERLGRNIFTPSTRDNKSLTARCAASPYATDLIARAPKYKFLFVVQFTYNDGYAELNELDFAFVVKKSTRPNISMQHEDVNYYNFRTKAVTKVMFEEMSMSFHDDTQNYATRFYTAYTRAMSPITNARELHDPESLGMDFANSVVSNGVGELIEGTIQSNHYTATRGPLLNNQKQILKEVKLFHVFDYGQKMNVYRFMNPRITQFILDDVDMSVGDQGSEVSIRFNYDSVFVDLDVPMDDAEYAIADRSRNAVYPLRYNDGTATSAGSNGAPIDQPTNPTDSCSPQTDTRNPPPALDPNVVGFGAGTTI